MQVTPAPSPADATPERVERETRAFVERVVIALGLCPFAQDPWRAGRVAMRVSHARDERALLADLDAEMARLVATPAAELETTLLVHPYVLVEFAAYNDFLDAAEALLAERGHEGVLQIASFHPDYRFADAPEGDPANATNRSPWPMLHLLREASVTEAVATHPDVEGVPARNVAMLRGMGRETVEGLLRSIRSSDAPKTGPETAGD